MDKKECKNAARNQKARRAESFKKRMLHVIAGILCSLSAIGLTSAASIPPEAEVPQQMSSQQTMIQLTVPYISQENLLPTGCEIVSALVLLHYWGVPASSEKFLERLPQEPLKQVGNTLVGPNPDHTFVGDPHDEQGYGCYPPVLVQTINTFLPSLLQAYDTTGTPLPTLAKTYLPKNEPVLVWATIDMKPPTQGTTWTLQDSGASFTWIGGEHCLVLCGYDAAGYWFNDPYDSNGLVYWDKETADLRCRQMGLRSAVIRRTS